MALRAVSIRDARQQQEWLHTGRIRSDLRDKRLKMTDVTPSTSPSAKVFSRDAVLACDKPRPARHARTDTVYGSLDGIRSRVARRAVEAQPLEGQLP